MAKHSERPLVSVLMLTYNHGAYLRQAIESVLAQRTDFRFELVIADDCSTDDARNIATEFAQSHPDIVVPIIQDRNVGWRNNFNAAFGRCRGQLIACLEGDDYWTRIDKLQMQADYLRTHPECSLSFTRVRKVDDASGAITGILPAIPVRPVSSIGDIIAAQFVQTCSVMFRKNAYAGGMPAWFEGLRLGDWPTWILIARHGNLGFLDVETAAYRVHQGGLWSGTDPVTMCKEVIRMLTRLERHVGRKYRRLVRAAISREYFELSWLLRDQGKHSFAKQAIGRCVTLKPVNRQLPLARVYAMWARYHAAPVYRAGKAFLG